SPEPGLLAKQARAALDQAHRVLWRPGNAYRAFRYGLIEAAVERLGSGAGADELLSYVLFDPSYFASQIAQGERDAAAAAKVGWQLVPPTAAADRKHAKVATAANTVP
ncbi:MAG TPA: hypothetical protein VMF89_05160, partial [Polyangiales bacterium]|nr:hypothetical protein [Polyangiales bacterium]